MTFCPYKVMLVDDSVVMRSIFKRILNQDPDIDIVASADNGKMAIDILQNRDDIDVIVLDIEMPIMDGLTAIPKILAIRPNINIIMASSLTRRNAEVSLKALERGAKDYIPKPGSIQETAELESFHNLLTLKVKTLGGQKRRKEKQTLNTLKAPLIEPKITSLDTNQFLAKKINLSALNRIDAIAIGSSTGGPTALNILLKGLPKTIKKPIFITQHMPATFTTILAEHLTRDTGFKCQEALDKQTIEGGKVYIAPGNFHLQLKKEGQTVKTVLSDAPPENFCRPAVDVMLKSLHEVYEGNILVIILTGMGQDGLKGAQLLSSKGAVVIAQDEQSSVVWGMPGAVAQAGICLAVLPIDKIAGYIQDNFFRLVA
jgi:two-component system, chemotaxis family, protein-glutamate methylesterase/glutaminase